MAKEPKTLDDLFHDTLKDIYFAEKKILTALPKMAKAAQSEGLKAAFEKHHGETEGQVTRLEQENQQLEAKLEAAGIRAKQMLDRVRFLRQQAQGADR